MKTVKPLPDVASGNTGGQKHDTGRRAHVPPAGASPDQKQEIPVDNSTHNLSSENPKPVAARDAAQPTEPATSEIDPDQPDAQYFHHLDAIIQAQRELMEVIVQGASLQQTLTNIALVIERTLDSTLCSIHLVDPKGELLQHYAAPSLPSALSLTTDAIEIGPDNGPIAAAAYRRQAVAVADVEVDPLCRHFRMFARQYGVRACTTHPIQSAQDGLLGTLTVYHTEPPSPLVSESRVIELVASLANFAISIERRERSPHFAIKRFSSLAATIPGVVYQRLVTADGDIRYTYISEGAKDLFGVSPKEILADPQALFVCHGPEYRATFRDRLLKASRELTMWDVEAQIITRDGEEKWTHAIARPHRQPDGSVLWDGVILDATRIKKAELELCKAKKEAEAASRAHEELLEMLRSANQRFASLATSIPGVVYQRRVSPDGDIRYTYISEGAKDLFGVPAEEILADPQALFHCHGPEYRATFRDRLLKASRELTMWDVEAQIITRDGEEKWTHAIARPHRQPDGSVLWDGVILDATWIKKAGLELRKAKELAESSSRAKSHFLAQMSHELRTPLNAILGFSELLQSEAFGPLGSDKYVEYAKGVNQAGTHLLESINDILEFTELESGVLELEEGHVVVADLIDAAMKHTAQYAELAGVDVSKDIEHDPLVMLADEKKLTKTLVNLLSNAVKFTPRDGHVRVTATKGEAGNVVISVTDTGIGISEEDMPKLFEPFGQVDSDLNRRFEGIGLGITLADSMAKLHDATLTFESKVGQGTKATITFPASRTLEEASDGGAADSRPSLDETGGGKSRRHETQPISAPTSSTHPIS